MDAEKVKKNYFCAGCHISSLSPGTVKSALTLSEIAFLNKKRFGVETRVVSFKAYREKKMRAKPYKHLTITRCNPTPKYPQGEWYIEYKYLVPFTYGQYKGVKDRGDLNKISDPIEREKEAQFLLRDTLKWLEAGNLPVFALKIMADKRADLTEEIIKEKKAVRKDWSLADAVNKYLVFLAAKGYAHHTERTYRKYVNALEAWLVDSEMQDIKARDFTEYDLEQFLNDRAEDANWSGRTFNNYLEYYVGFFAVVEKMENRERKKNRLLKIVYEIDVTDIDKRISNPQRNKAYTPLMAAAIKKALKKPGRENLRDYIEWISLSFMRPDEIRHLKVENIDPASRQIRIIGKTGDRLIPISNQMMDLIKKRNILKHPLKTFMFGYMGSVDARRMSVAYFLEQYAVVKIEAGIGPEYGPYNWKHTYVQLMLSAGYSEEEIMVKTGHKTKEAFRAYTAGFYLDNSELMKGLAIDF